MNTGRFGVSAKKFGQTGGNSMFSDLKQKVTSWDKQALADPNKTQLYSPSPSVSQHDTQDGQSPKGNNLSKAIMKTVEVEPTDQTNINQGSGTAITGLLPNIEAIDVSVSEEEIGE